MVDRRIKREVLTVFRLAATRRQASDGLINHPCTGGCKRKWLLQVTGGQESQSKKVDYSKTMQGQRSPHHTYCTPSSWIKGQMPQGRLLHLQSGDDCIRLQAVHFRQVQGQYSESIRERADVIKQRPCDSQKSRTPSRPWILHTAVKTKHKNRTHVCHSSGKRSTWFRQVV
ncbi:hypothetical protein BC835DRAFT_663429 [Cytidiella melzeri]|nr:hypothetical protein BC835DRAFT_663429 [Cytidiella melzeri]